MLFGEMLSDERREGHAEGHAQGYAAGQQKGQEQLLHLIALMESGGDKDQIPNLYKDPELLAQMFRKYNIGA